ncbi:transcriptional regulator [Flavobacterium noncentrifugens]|uniref:cAMP-binding domain of CRP or a regulatory subunit of cAMP-dependent protein kinases n=1 Tax=Flavobacterium noncentrifugens TaxID=1128970 RepID=A0A1G8WXZ7_9FLAO|nr:response regulator [Flavobacterium noncentrifugens]GEP51087.1 transcriptional regulator [Flavobacterium noncentrifugens]SDJ82946.1 cAMP-binding domain of CRP or a regulatory subunit of cAMP-dependent protein kinases [Flavobacterium noncentrifugens]
MTKALIIEDNNDIRESIAEILGLAGYEVHQAPNGKIGVEIALKEIPDIILCDIMMPELDGYGVLYLLHKNPKTSTIPFIFITAKSERLDLRRAMEMGADDYLTKPFDAIELLNAIESRLKRKNSQQDFYSHSLENIGDIVNGKEGLSEFKKIIEERVARSFQKNQVVHYEGDRASGVYLVISGKIKTIKLSEDGRELMTGIYEADDFLGVNCLLSDATFTDTATAIEDSQLCFFPKEQLEELLRFYPDVAGKFIKILSNENRIKDSHLLELAYQSVRKRIAKSLLRLFPKGAIDGSHISITRDDLAAMSGTASETVSRTLTEFRNEGLIEKKGSIVTILDQLKISRMKN